MARVVVEFLVPIHEDESLGSGELHPPFRWRALERRLEEEFGGFSSPDHRVEGVWIEPGTGRRVEDRSRQFGVDVDEERLDLIRAIIQEACRDFMQQCIRTVIRGEVEYLEPGERDENL